MSTDVFFCHRKTSQHMAVLGYFVKRGLVPRSGRPVANAQARGARAECRLTITFVPITHSIPK